MQQILITGANRGIGLALIKRYLQKKDSFLYASYRSPDRSNELLQLEQDHPDRIVTFAMDVTLEADIVSAYEQVRSHTDHLDILINNAGINPSRAAQSFNNINEDLLMQVLRTNSIAPLMVTRAFVDLLRRSEHARLVNVSSQLGSLERMRSGGLYAYATSKAALNMITRALAGDLAPEGIITITLHPGWVQTDMGGASASLSSDQSAASIEQLIASLKPSDNGEFFKWNGERHPW